MSLHAEKNQGDSNLILSSRVAEFRKKKDMITALETGGIVITSRNQLANLIPRTIAVIPVAFLKKLEGQPRFIFDKKDLGILSTSIKEKGDVNEPLHVTIRQGENGEWFGQIFGGERRCRATKMAGISNVSCLIYPPMSDAELFAAAATDGMGKKPLSPIEEAMTILRLQEEYGWSDTKIANRLSMSLTKVQQTKRYLNLSSPYQEKLTKGEITRGKALILSKWYPKDQDTLYGIIREVEKALEGKLISPNDLDIQVSREAQERGIKRPAPPKSSRGKKRKTIADRSALKVSRGVKAFIKTMNFALELKEWEINDSEVNIMDLIELMETLLKKATKFAERLDKWD